MKESRHATVYKRRDSLFIRSSSQTDVGLWLEQGPCTRVSYSSSSAAEVGRATWDALARSGSIIPHPTVWKSVDVDNPILEAAGIKRWSIFLRGALNVGVWLEDNQLEVTPTVNEGKEGFAHLDDDAVYLRADASVEELATAISEALKRCK